MEKRSLIFVVALAFSIFCVQHFWFNSTTPTPKAATEVKQEQTIAAPIEAPPAAQSFASVQSTDGENYYVLENDYQQLVFSSKGGALVEINLPLHTSKDSKSIVRPIGFDRIMEKKYANNDYFPQESHFVYKNGQMQKVESGTLDGYYPLLRRSIKSPEGRTSLKVAPHFYGMNIISDDSSLENAEYKVKRFDKDSIEFELEQPNRRIIKTFYFPKDADNTPYCFYTTVKVEGNSRGLWITSGVPEVELISGNSTPQLKYLMKRNDKLKVENVDLPKTTTAFSSIHPRWLATSNGFLGMIIEPLTEMGSGFTAHYVPGEVDPTRLTMIDSKYDLYPAEKYPGYELHIPLKPTNEPTTMRVFAGPFQDDILSKIDTAFSDPGKGYAPHYDMVLSFQGWFTFISEPFGKFLFYLMKFFYSFTHSWGFSIILLTVALRIMLYPLNNWSIKSTVKMQRIAPQISAIQAKYKKDPKRAQMEIMGLYRQSGVNPISGCFPLLIQLPFLIGMFDLLKSVFELRGASFIPGWIDNLTAPDVLFSWSYPIPFIGTEFHALPIIIGVVMFFQQRFSSSVPKDKSLMTDQQRQQVFMGNIMTLVFTFLFYHFPSGLNLYWLFSMLLTILQQWWTMKKLKHEPSIVVIKG